MNSSGTVTEHRYLYSYSKSRRWKHGNQSHWKMLLALELWKKNDVLILTDSLAGLHLPIPCAWYLLWVLTKHTIAQRYRSQVLLHIYVLRFFFSFCVMPPIVKFAYKMFMVKHVRKWFCYCLSPTLMQTIRIFESKPCLVTLTSDCLQKVSPVFCILTVANGTLIYILVFFLFIFPPFFCRGLP